MSIDTIDTIDSIREKIEREKIKLTIARTLGPSFLVGAYLALVSHARSSPGGKFLVKLDFINPLVDSMKMVPTDEGIEIVYTNVLDEVINSPDTSAEEKLDAANEKANYEKALAKARAEQDAGKQAG